MSNPWTCMQSAGTRRRTTRLAWLCTFLLVGTGMVPMGGCRTPDRDAAGTSAAPLDFRLDWAPSMRHKQDGLGREIRRALDEVSTFFGAAGFPVGRDDLIDTVVVLEWTPETRAGLAESFGMRAEDLPATFAGTAVERTLYLVVEARYREIWESLYPDWPWEADTYRRLIVHELTHRAHEAVAMERLGSADAMGPIWFFEGLAVLCAGQFDRGEPPMTKEELSGHLAGGRTPSPSYPLYGRLVRSLASRHAMGDLIARAARPGFPYDQ